MTPQKSNYIIGNFLQFSPYIIFITVYCFLYCYTLSTKNYLSSTIIFTGLPVFTVFIATLYSFFTFREPAKIDEKIEIFLFGAADRVAMHNYFTIIFIAVFNYMLAKTNGVLTVATLSLLYIPTLWFMPCIFLIASTIAIILSSLPATIIICMPIAHAIAQSLHINSALMAATIIGGALYGNHLSLYFNSIKTHIKSTPTDSINIYKKTIWFILLAALSTLIILSQYQCQIIHPAVYDYLKASLEIQDSITVLPYVFLLIAAYFKINLLANLTLACCITLITEIIYHKILFLDAITTMFHGFYEESIACNLLLLHIITAGLIEIIKYNGGFIYIIEKLNLKGDQNSSIVEGSIICMTIIVNMLVIIDKLAFNLLANYIKKLCDTYNISQSKAIILSQIIATTMQTILPYSSIMFLAIYIHKSSFIEIMSYMIYPILVIIMTILSVLFSNSNIENKNESYNIHKNS